MTAVIDQIGTAIVVDLNADPLTNFGETFTAKQSGGDFDLQLQDVGPPGSEQVLSVDVVAVSDEMDLATTVCADGTKDVHHECTLQVIVRKRLDERIETTGELLFAPVQALTEVVEKIAKYFIARTLSTLDEAGWISRDGDGIEAIRVHHDLRELSQFTGIARISYEFTERA